VHKDPPLSPGATAPGDSFRRLSGTQTERLFSKRLSASSLDELGVGVFGDDASWHVEFTFKWYPTVAGEQTNYSYTASSI
jgi:hypothetical protein